MGERGIVGTATAAPVGMPEWLRTPSGAHVLEWEQRHVDAAVADLFGFHALQLGMPQLDALRANRMPHRWLAVEQPLDGPGAPRPALRCQFDALPFDASSLDLVVMPHTLEHARDPHQALREVERVLMPEGRVLVTGFHAASLWGARQRLGRTRRALGVGPPRDLFLPSTGEFLAYRRLRDWLRLLSFEVEAGRFGCYIPPFASERWLSRFAWMERAGDGWWPVFGALYYVVAVKRVRGMRLVGLARETPRATSAAAAAKAPVTAVHVTPAPDRPPT
jgi:SAM-dependent methyltransferase